MSSDQVDDTRRTWQALKALTKDRSHWLNRNHGLSELADPSEETRAEIIRLIEAAVAEGSGFLDKVARMKPNLNGLVLNKLTAVLAQERVRQLIADEGVGSEQATDVGDLPSEMPPLTRQAVEQRQAELEAGGARYFGYGTLAKEFFTSRSKIRRLMERTP